MKRQPIIESIIDGGLITPGSYVVIGLSGGPDSLCLLHALAQLQDSYDLTIVPVHVNHHLRPEADEEADHADLMCERLGLECSIFEANCEEMARDLGISTEEAGRRIRYEVFDDVAKEIESHGIPRERILIAVAHNADDQSETVLFRLMRGTGLHGLAGMPIVRTSEMGYMIVRPLLFTERSDIEDYIRANHLRPNIDGSNAGTDYTRNKIRNELIPYLEKNYNPNIKQALRKFASIAELDDALLTDIAYAAMEGHLNVDEETGRVMLDITQIRDNPPSINTRIAGFILQTLRMEMNASYELMTAIAGLMYSDNPSASIDLPGGYRAYREYDTVIFARSDQEITIRANDNLRMFPQVMMIKEFHPDEDCMYAAFDFDKFNEAYPGKVGELTLRTRREGDYLPMKRGRKKIQDLLVDSKVMKNARDSILMVAIESEVLWVLPSRYFSGRREQEKGRFSPKYHITEETSRVLYIEIVENI